MTHAPWTALAAIARRQAGAFSLDQMLSVGFPSSTLYDQVRRGQLVRVQPTVYVMAGTPVTATTLEHAALLRFGQAATLSHLSAAAILGLAPQPDRPWLTIPAGMRAPAAREGLHVQRSRTVEVLCLGDGRRITPLPRTLVDLGQCLDERELTATHLRATQRNPAVHDRIADCLERLGPSYPGSGVGRRVNAEFSPAMESILGAELYGLLSPHCPELVPGFRFLLPDRTERVFDLAVPSLRMDIEADSWAFHGSKAQQENDRRRDRQLFTAGIHTTRFVTDEIRRAPEQTVRDFLAAVARRRRDLAA
jgi:very-short-patch-repair endonuclease